MNPLWTVFLILVLSVASAFPSDARMVWVVGSGKGVEIQVENEKYQSLGKSDVIATGGKHQAKIFLSLHSLGAALAGEGIFHYEAGDKRNDEKDSHVLVTVMHVLPDGEYPYETFRVYADSTTSISGYKGIDVIGEKIRVMAEAFNMPMRQLTLQSTCYFHDR